MPASDAEEACRPVSRAKRIASVQEISWSSITLLLMSGRIGLARRKIADEHQSARISEASVTTKTSGTSIDRRDTLMRECHSLHLQRLLCDIDKTIMRVLIRLLSPPTSGRALNPFHLASFWSCNVQPTTRCLLAVASLPAQ